MVRLPHTVAKLIDDSECNLSSMLASRLQISLLATGTCMHQIQQGQQWPLPTAYLQEIV